MRRRAFILGPAAVATLATCVIVATETPFAYERPGLRVALETTAALAASFAAFLTAGRFLRSRNLPDLVLATALGVLAVGNLAFAAIPASFGDVPAALTWSSVAAHVAGALLLAAAALLPQRLTARPERAALVALSAAAAGLALVPIALSAASPLLPAGVERAPSSDPTLLDLTSHPLVLAAHLTAAAAFLVAAAGLARRSERTGDPLLRWFAVAALMGAFARMHYAVYPSLYSQWLYTGDLFRLLFYGLLLGGALREIGGYWRGLARAAVLEERRRVARDLHDGVAQELAFIVRRARRRGDDDADAAVIVAAAERALADSRRAIAALTRPARESFDVALAEAVEDVAARTGTPLELDLAPGVTVDARAQEALIRIASEAVANAARHAEARRVRLELAGKPRVRLRISDDGRGFDPAAVRTTEANGFGLTSMRERAAAINAELAITSRAGEGTQVEVTLA